MNVKQNGNSIGTNFTPVAESEIRPDRIAARYRTLFETMTQGVVFQDASGATIFANPAAEHILGLTLDQMLGRASGNPRWHAIREDGSDFPGAEHPGVVALRTGREVRNVVMGIMNPDDGRYRWLNLNAVPQFLPGESVPFEVCTIFDDITERKQAEEALRKVTIRRDAILSAIPDIIVEVNERKVYIWANEAGLRFFGDDVVGKEASSFFEGEQDTYFQVQPLFNGGEETLYLESWQRRHDRERRLLAWRCKVLKDDRGRVVGALSTARDITESKRADEAIRTLNAELEQRVVERTANLQAANKELEAFSYSVSHDLRAPLRGIDGWSHALLEDYGDQLDEQALTFIHRVRTDAQRMSQLIDDLLQLSHLTRAEMHTERVDLSGMVQMLAARLREHEPQRDVEFVIHPGLSASGDARLLESALANLLGNAFKFTSRRGDARIEFGQTVTQGRRAFFVRDNGAGFDMGFAKKLFGAFQRMHTTSEFPGSGIGLATVQRIVHRHGGQVWADAQVNQGATFYFNLGEDR